MPTTTAQADADRPGKQNPDPKTTKKTDLSEKCRDSKGLRKKMLKKIQKICNVLVECASKLT